MVKQVVVGLGFVVMAGCASEAAPSATVEPPVPALESEQDAALRAFENRPLRESKALYETLTVQERANLWGQQIDRILAGSKLSDSERTFLLNLRDKVAEALVGNLDQLGAELEAVFGVERARTFFGKLGNPNEGAKSTMAIQRHPTGACTEGWSCGGMECSPWGGSCVCWTCSSNCTPTTGGCGWWWGQPCTGVNGPLGPCN